jgi:hypothetical protein
VATGNFGNVQADVVFDALPVTVKPRLLFAVPTAVQDSPSPQMKAANDLFAAQKWAEAAKAYEAVVAIEPDNARAWNQLGTARFSLNQFELSIPAFEKNIALTKNPITMYNLACAFARLNRKTDALEWLERAVANDLPPYNNIAADEDVANLREEPRFKEALATLERRRHPCVYSDAAKQFDFWVGEWDVFNPQGRKAGTSVIQKIAEGCGVLENWTGSLGGSGKSINFYDPRTERWHQYWIGATGIPARYVGVFKDGAMRYEGEQQKDAKLHSRLTFFNVDANTVRQLSEKSSDGGNTWTTEYDFKYVRRKNM